MPNLEQDPLNAATPQIYLRCKNASLKKNTCSIVSVCFHLEIRRSEGVIIERPDLYVTVLLFLYFFIDLYYLYLSLSFPYLPIRTV